MNRTLHRWRYSSAMTIVLFVAVGNSLLSDHRYARKLAAYAETAPISAERVERCRAAAARAHWPTPDTDHTFTVSRTLAYGLAMVERAWPDDCAVLTVIQTPTGGVGYVMVHAATGGQPHTRALLQVTTHNQGLAAPPTAAEGRHVFLTGRLPYVPAREALRAVEPDVAPERDPSTARPAPNAPASPPRPVRERARDIRINPI